MDASFATELHPSTPTFQVKRRRPRSAKIAPSDVHRQPRWCPTRALSVRAECDAHLHLPQLGMPLGEPTTAAGFGATAAAERLNHMGAASSQGSKTLLLGIRDRSRPKMIMNNIINGGCSPMGDGDGGAMVRLSPVPRIKISSGIPEPPSDPPSRGWIFASSKQAAAV